MWWRASERSIRESVKNAMAICRETGFGSVAFPLIGTGSGGFAHERAQSIMTEAIGRDAESITVVIVKYEKK
jgi:O-acetyl-ADP-ribose deacetylase (regulator of RNase III)